MPCLYCAFANSLHRVNPLCVYCKEPKTVSQKTKEKEKKKKKKKKKG